MTLDKKKIGFVITGSFCTFETALECLEETVDNGANVTAILSYAADNMDTRFMSADGLKEALVNITGNPIIRTIVEAEPIGPKKLFDLLVVLPATGNTIAKLANGITDTPATMAIKAHLRNNRPVLFGISTNDALGNNAKNIGMLLNSKNIYFIPFGPDDPIKKPNSIVFHKNFVIPAMEEALENKQFQPMVSVVGL